MIVAGFGFTSRASVASLRDACARACHTHHADLLATVTEKAETIVFKAFAKAEGIPCQNVNPEVLREQITITHSNQSQLTYETGSVAEAAALAAAGPGAQLLGPRVISADRMATCALAIRETP